jgi:NAD-dependent DNA ligase
MEQKLIQMKRDADEAYFNSGNPIMSDEVYDGLCQYLENKDDQTLSIGCAPSIGNKINLPVYMGSLTKCNNDEKINNFISKSNLGNHWVIQEKLDGISCLYVPHLDKLYTRGDGVVGTDISHLLKYGLNVPNYFKTNYMVRGELIITRKIFKEHYASQYACIRNMVSGQVSTKTPNKDVIKHVDFVAYEVIKNKDTQLPISNQMFLLQKYNFKVVHHRIIDQNILNSEVLSDYLNRRKNKSKYEIDGLVITSKEKYVRNNKGDPKHSFAFKIQGETTEAVVDHIKWNLSKSGKYKPQIFINPVRLNGVTISSLTGFNAKYIVNNHIGKDAILLITRSGDVIPHIITVLKESWDLNLPVDSQWNSVDLYHNLNYTPSEVIIKQMVYFFSTLKCLNCKDKTIIKIYNAGFQTIESIIQAEIKEFEKIEGIGTLSATKLLMSIRGKIKDATVHELLAALNSFGEGIGLKKIQNIDLNNPQNLKIKGLSEATIKEKILPIFQDQLNRVLNIKKIVMEEDEISSSTLSQQIELQFKDRVFVFSGFRDSSLEKQIFNLGGRVTTAISNKTTDLIISSNYGKSSTKLLKAKKLGINVITKSEFLLEMSKNVKVEIDYDEEDNYSN